MLEGSGNTHVGGNSALYFKQILKKNPLIYSLNAKIKAHQTIRSYHALNEYYKKEASRRGIDYHEEDVSRLVMQNLKQRGVKQGVVPKGNLRIFWVGANYAQDSSGIIRALQGFGEVILFEGRPGKYEQILPIGSDSRIAREENSRQLTIQIHKALKNGPIHAIIGQMWPHTIIPKTLQTLRNKGLVVVNISMDDRHVFRRNKVNGVWSGTSGLIPAIDLACTAAKECRLWYRVEGCPSIYLPEASDPKFFKPSSEPKLYDVSFVGANYGIRRGIVTAAEKRGIKVACFGRGWPNGRISTEKIPELFSKSRIVLGIGTIGHCSDFYALKMRDFDAPMSGSLYITHDNPDLYDLYEVGKEIVTYRYPEECAQKIAYYLNHQEEAERIAKAGRERAVREHTWEKRFEKMLQVVELVA